MKVLLLKKLFKINYEVIFKIKPQFTLTSVGGGAMVLGKRPVPGRPTIWITVGQGPAAHAVGAGGSSLDIFTVIYPFSFLPLFGSLADID